MKVESAPMTQYRGERNKKVAAKMRDKRKKRKKS
jgi:hypothetical protein